MSKKKHPPNYASIAKTLSGVVPSVKKYSKRKRLNRWEKGAITRAANKVKREGGLGSLQPLTKQQAKKLRNKNALVGDGINAIHVQNVTRTGKVSIDDSGEILIRDRGRTFHTVSLPLDINAYLAEAERLIDEHGNRVAIFPWTVKGRAAEGFNSLNKLAEALANKYFFRYKQIEEWLLGFVYYVQ